MARTSLLSGAFGFRNLADPTELGDPSHWADRATPGFGDNRGVHYNSLIPGHAFYLMANGGRNARCSGPTDPQTDCDVVVPAIPMADAAQIFFTAWEMLPDPSPANSSNPAFQRQFCNARNNSLEAAELLFPGSDDHFAAAYLAWAAVGVKVPNGTACDAADDWHLQASPRSIVLAPGGSGSINVDVTAANAASVTVSGGSPATVDYDEPNTEIDISVPAGMPEGIYPLVVEGSGSNPATKRAAAVLIVDATPPDASVDGVSLASSGTVSTSGTVPLVIAWGAQDAASGLASSHLQRLVDVNPDDWANVASGSGPSTVITGANAESFRATATDSIGNSTTSPTSGPWNVSRYQESAATYTAPAAWLTASPAGAWGGSVRYAALNGSAARFVFTGSDVAWISIRAGDRGKAKVFMDGVFQRKVNLAAGTFGSRQIVFRATGLSNAAAHAADRDRDHRQAGGRRRLRNARSVGVWSLGRPARGGVSPHWARISAAWAASSMVEQLTLNQLVEGSSPSRLTNPTRTHEMTPQAMPRGFVCASWVATR